MVIPVFLIVSIDWINMAMFLCQLLSVVKPMPTELSTTQLEKLKELVQAGLVVMSQKTVPNSKFLCRQSVTSQIQNLKSKRKVWLRLFQVKGGDRGIEEGHQI